MAKATIPAADREVRSDDNAPDPFDACAVHVDSLYEEVGHWADGQEIENEKQAAAVDQLIDDVKAAIEACENARDEAIRPLTEQVTSIRERWYPLIGETKKVTGRLIRAKAVLLQAKTIWGNKVRARQAAEAERLRQEALKKAQEAGEAARAAVGNLEASEEAEALVREAQGLLKGAQRAEKDVPKGMRTIWRVEVAQPNIALRTMWQRHPQDMIAFAKQLAERDVREGRRTLEGFTITEDKVAF
jgi:hypothetical protein